MNILNKTINFIKKNYEKITSVLIVFFIVNVFLYIFFFCKSLLNSDSAFVVDYSLEQIRTSSFFPANWVNTNDFWVYSLIPLITLFLKLGISLLASRQLSVFVQTVLLIILVRDFYKNLLQDKKGLKIFLMLLLSGISGQFMFEMYGDATYATIIFYMLLELWLLLRYLKKEKKINLIFFGIILALITTCSLRFPIYIAAPIIVLLLYYIYENGLQKKYVNAFLIVLLATVIGFIGNKILINSLTYSISVQRGIVSDYSLFSDCISRMVFDYFWLNGGTGLSTHSLTMIGSLQINANSPLIALVFIKYVYAIISIIMPFMLLSKFKKMDQSEKGLYIYVVSFMCIIIFFLIIGNMAFWYRYLIPVIFFLNMLYPLFYKYFFKSVERNRIVFELAILLFSITSVLLISFSFINYKEFAFRENVYERIVSELEKRGLTFGYTVDGNEHNLYRTISNGKVQVVRINEDGDGITYWLNTKDWYSNDYYRGKVFLIEKPEDGPFDFEKYSIEEFYVDTFKISIFNSNDVILRNLKDIS